MAVFRLGTESANISVVQRNQTTKTKGDEMTKQEFKRAFQLAEGPASGRDNTAMDQGLFNGFGLRFFAPVTCTVAQVASLISYQARQLDGGWDVTALTEIYPDAKKAFIIAD